MKTFLKKIATQQGFSIVQITVAAGLLGALSLGVSKMVNQMGKSGKKVNQDLEVRNLTNLIINNLGNHVACKNSFTNVPGASPAIKTELDADLITSGQRFGGANKFKISDIRIGDYIGGTQQRATIFISIEKETAGVGDGVNTVGSLTSDIKIPVRIKATGANVDTCYVDRGDIAESLCEGPTANFDGKYKIDENFECQSIKVRKGTGKPAAITIATGSVEITNTQNSIVNADGGNIDIASSVGIGTSRSTGVGNISLSGAIVGADLPSNPLYVPRGPGNINVSGGVNVGSSSGVGNGILQTTQDLIANGGASIGLPGTPDPATGELISDGNIFINDLKIDETVGNYVATTEWVRYRIATTLASALGPEISVLAADILNDNYGESGSGLNVIKKSACITSTTTSANGALVTGVWNAGANTCSYNVLHCSAVGVCANVYSNGLIQAGGNIVSLTGSVTATGNITSTNGLLTANTYIRSTNSFVQSESQVWGRSRVCAGSTSSCYTKFHSVLCTGKNVLVGVSNGHFICASKW